MFEKRKISDLPFSWQGLLVFFVNYSRLEGISIKFIDPGSLSPTENIDEIYIRKGVIGTFEEAPILKEGDISKIYTTSYENFVYDQNKNYESLTYEDFKEEFKEDEEFQQLDDRQKQLAFNSRGFSRFQISAAKYEFLYKANIDFLKRFFESSSIDEILEKENEIYHDRRKLNLTINNYIIMLRDFGLIEEKDINTLGWPDLLTKKDRDQSKTSFNQENTYQPLDIDRSFFKEYEVTKKGLEYSLKLQEHFDRDIQFKQQFKVQKVMGNITIVYVITTIFLAIFTGIPLFTSFLENEKNPKIILNNYTNDEKKQFISAFSKHLSDANKIKKADLIEKNRLERERLMIQQSSFDQLLSVLQGKG